MKKLKYDFDVRMQFDPPISAHSYALRILPPSDREQGIYSPEYEIDGEGSPSFWTDGFGNQVLSGYYGELHDQFHYRVSGIAFVHRRPGNRIPAAKTGAFLSFTPLTRTGDHLQAFFREHLPTADSTGEARVNHWVQAVYSGFRYEAGVTSISTAAEEALAGGCGVCQDYAHILLNLLRQDRIPARYVAGLMLGEGATHAWCEACVDGVWIGIDPTHGCPVNDNYIKLAQGRDYDDCIIDRGRFTGITVQSQQITAKVIELSGGK